MRLLRRQGSRSRGQALAEFALIVPVLVLGIFSIIDFGRFVYTQNLLNDASREGARAVSVKYLPAECGTQARALCAETVSRNRLIGVIGSGTVTVTCTRISLLDNSMSTIPAGNCTVRDLFKVTVTNNFALVTPVIAQFLGTQALRGETQVTIQST